MASNQVEVLTTLVDEYAVLSAKIKELTEQQGAMKAKFKSSGYGTIEGDSFVVVVGTESRNMIDQKALKEKMGDEFLAPFMKTSSITKVTVKPKAEEE